MFAIVRTTKNEEKSVMAMAKREADLQDAYHHYLSGPDGPAVGSRFADYDIVEIDLPKKRKITQIEMGAILKSLASIGLDMTNDCIPPGTDSAEGWAKRCRGINCISVFANGTTPHGCVRFDDPGSMHPMHRCSILFAPDHLSDMEYNQIGQLRRKADRLFVVVESEWPEPKVEPEIFGYECANGHQWNGPEGSDRCPKCGEYAV